MNTKCLIDWLWLGLVEIEECVWWFDMVKEARETLEKVAKGRLVGLEWQGAEEYSRDGTWVGRGKE